MNHDEKTESFFVDVGSSSGLGRIKAVFLDIEEGALVFRDADREIVAAFNEWASVRNVSRLNNL